MGQSVIKCYLEHGCCTHKLHSHGYLNKTCKRWGLSRVHLLRAHRRQLMKPHFSLRSYWQLIAVNGFQGQVSHVSQSLLSFLPMFIQVTLSNSNHTHTCMHTRPQGICWEGIGESVRGKENDGRQTLTKRFKYMYKIATG